MAEEKNKENSKKLEDMDEREIRNVVRQGYSQVAKNQSSCCGPGVSSCCGSPSDDAAVKTSRQMGYSDDEMDGVPDGANLGLGCGNPTALASLKEGEVVVDLGSGAGFDCFLSAQKVGNSGKVIGVDMTHEMVDKARQNAKKGNYDNVEFRLGEIENLPVADNTADIIISNCVINLSPNKERVFEEALRVLRPGGRVMVSDVVLKGRLPEKIMNSLSSYIGCVSGAILMDDYLSIMKEAGFEDIKVIDEIEFPVEFVTNDPNVQAIMKEEKLTEDMVKEIGALVLSIKVSAIKPN